MKALTICPTRGRVERFKEFLSSFQDMTSERTELLVICDRDDPCLMDYKQIYPDVEFKERASLTEIFNTAFKEKYWYDFYHLANDDFIYHTKNWDITFADMEKECGKGIFYGSDLLQNDNLCVAPFISGDIIRALGWLQMPGLYHLYGDMVWKNLGQILNILFYNKDVVIEHKHWLNNKELIDDVYKVTNSPAMYKKDGDAFKVWYEQQMDFDVQKIKEVL